MAISTELDMAVSGSKVSSGSLSIAVCGASGISLQFSPKLVFVWLFEAVKIEKRKQLNSLISPEQQCDSTFLFLVKRTGL